MSRASVIYVLVNSLALAFERSQPATLLLGLEMAFLSTKPTKRRKVFDLSPLCRMRRKDLPRVRLGRKPEARSARTTGLWKIEARFLGKGGAERRCARRLRRPSDNRRHGGRARADVAGGRTFLCAAAADRALQRDRLAGSDAECGTDLRELLVQPPDRTERFGARQIGFAELRKQLPDRQPVRI